MAELGLLTDPATMAPQVQGLLTGPLQDDLHLRFSASSPDRPANLVIGLELKFLVPFLRQGHPDPSPANPRPIAPTPHADSPALLLQQAYALVTDALRAAHQRAISITEITSRDRQESDFWSEHWIVKKSNSAEIAADPPSSSSCGAAATPVVYAPLEISSPRLPALAPRTYAVVRSVVRALDARCRFTVNFTCEAHVHVGRADGTPLSLASLRNIAALAWLTEPVLRLVKDPRSPNFRHIYTWSSPLRQHSRLAAMVSGLKDTHPHHHYNHQHHPQRHHHHHHLHHVPSSSCAAMTRDSLALSTIFSAPDTLSLGRLLSGDERRYRRLGFNFSAFGLEDERAGRSPRSVEVRFFEDYRGEDEVLGWIRVCVALGVAAVEESGERLLAVARTLTGCEGRGAPGERMEELLGLLGVEEGVVKMFGDKVERIHSGLA